MLIKIKPVSFQMCLGGFFIAFVIIRNFHTQLSILHSKFISSHHVNNFRENILILLKLFVRKTHYYLTPAKKILHGMGGKISETELT
jgi:hypothetical protein